MSCWSLRDWGTLLYTLGLDLHCQCCYPVNTELLLPSMQLSTLKSLLPTTRTCHNPTNRPLLWLYLHIQGTSSIRFRLARRWPRALLLLLTSPCIVTVHCIFMCHVFQASGYPLILLSSLSCYMVFHSIHLHGTSYPMMDLSLTYGLLTLSADAPGYSITFYST